MMNLAIVQRFLSITLLALCLSLTLAGIPATAQAADPAGKVDAVAGEVTVAGADGSIRTLAKDAPVFAGDIISTGPNSRVRLVFSDQGVIFLRPSSRFVIDSYKHTGDKQQDESKFSLVKGGFRSVTGAIGQANKENVKIETPVATIGIRGTDHEGRFCAGDCLDLTNIGVSAPADGLYTATNVGQTMVGTQQFNAGQYGFTSPAGVTVRLPEPPPILTADPALRGAMTPQQQQEERRDQGTPGSGEQQEGGGQRSQSGRQTGQTSSQAGQGGANEQTGQGGNGGVLEIPAQPPATRSIQCW
ncbi:MAG: FecR family protein [Thermodesulfobacteriota bacterium]